MRSVKHHLRRVVGAHTLTFEEFTTLLCNVEACLNSRPLAPLHDTVEDYEPLTPGHFLIGSALTAIPEPSVLNIKENRLSRWQIVRQLTERFWKICNTIMSIPCSKDLNGKNSRKILFASDNSFCFTIRCYRPANGI